MALATKAADLVAHEGLAQACATMKTPGGPFNHGETYAFIMDMTGHWRCFPPNPKAEGEILRSKSGIPDGKAMLPEQIAIAKSAAGEGWVDYRWNNPATGKIQPKRSYVHRVPGEDFFAISGYYK